MPSYVPSLVCRATRVPADIKLWMVHVHSRCQDAAPPCPCPHPPTHRGDRGGADDRRAPSARKQAAFDEGTWMALAAISAAIDRVAVITSRLSADFFTPACRRASSVRPGCHVRHVVWIVISDSPLHARVASEVLRRAPIMNRTSVAGSVHHEVVDASAALTAVDSLMLPRTVDGVVQSCAKDGWYLTPSHKSPMRQESASSTHVADPKRASLCFSEHAWPPVSAAEPP